MSIDANPPGAGGDSGARNPTEENPRTEPPDSDPYAGLSLDDLHQKLMEKMDERERERLIRELKRVPESESPPSPKPDPSAAVSARAQRLREGVSVGGDGDGLRADIDRLRALFSDLLLHNTHGNGLDERHGLMIALRAQKQALDTVLALEKLQAAEKQQNSNPPR